MHAHIEYVHSTRARTHTHTHIHTQTHIGRKRWVLFPPGTPKALVKPAAWMAKKDREAIDWFLCHYRCVHACVCVCIDKRVALTPHCTHAHPPIRPRPDAQEHQRDATAAPAADRAHHRPRRDHFRTHRLVAHGAQSRRHDCGHAELLLLLQFSCRVARRAHVAHQTQPQVAARTQGQVHLGGEGRRLSERVRQRAGAKMRNSISGWPGHGVQDTARSRNTARSRDID